MGRPEFDFEQALTRWRARLTQNQELKAGEIEELEDHLREVYREELSSGDSPREAFRRAVGCLGAATLLEDAFRAEIEGKLPWWKSLIRQTPGFHELRYSCRRLLGNWGFSFSAILILALGIGANTAIFTIVNAIMLRPLPFSNPEQLVRVWAASPERDRDFGAFSFPYLMDWDERSTTWQKWDSTRPW